MSEVRDVADHLDERERTVLVAHFGLGQPAQTLDQIGGTLGLTAERARQIEAGALTKMREAFPVDPRRAPPANDRENGVRTGLVAAGAPERFEPVPEQGESARTGAWKMDSRRLDPNHLPTPFSAAEIAAACRPGRTLRYQIERAGQPPIVRVSRYVETDAIGAVQESWEESLDGRRLTEPTPNDRRGSTYSGMPRSTRRPRRVKTKRSRPRRRI